MAKFLGKNLKKFRSFWQKNLTIKLNLPQNKSPYCFQIPGYRLILFIAFFIALSFLGYHLYSLKVQNFNAQLAGLEARLQNLNRKISRQEKEHSQKYRQLEKQLDKKEQEAQDLWELLGQTANLYLSPQQILYNPAAQSRSLGGSNDAMQIPEWQSTVWFLNQMEWQADACLPAIQPCSGEITSRFGLRENPWGGGWEFHEGIDIADYHATPIYATAYGTVSNLDYGPGYGFSIEIDHQNGYTTLYAHLAQILVNQGDQVARGDLIGLMGDTGHTTGTHLHYEVRSNGIATDPTDFIPPYSFNPYSMPER